MKRPSGILILILALFAVSMGRAQEGSAKKGATLTAAASPATHTAAPARAEDEKAINAASQALAVAFQKGDEKAFANLFTEEAEYHDEESDPVRGREALSKAYRELFAKRKELKAEAKTDVIRFLGSDTAVEEGTFTVTPKDSPPNASRYSALYVRQNGKWLIALLKEWQDDTTNQPSLEDLAWLIGEWESTGSDMTARTKYSWAPNKTFIRMDYTITPKKEGETPSSGTQVIGVDPAVGKIRGWLFASDGGIGESNWEWDGEKWAIESIGTLVDGSATSALNLMTRAGDDAFTFKSVLRKQGEESLPDVPTVTIKRVAPGGAK